MARLIFVNKNSYDVFVPTPSGAGRRIKIGEAVEGDYFVPLANSGVLDRYTGNPDAIRILCAYNVSTYLHASESKFKPAKPVAPLVPVFVEAENAVPAASTAPTVEEVPAEVIAAPATVTALTPSEKDLFALSMDELRMVAATMGLDPAPDVKKKTIIKMINSSKK